MSDWYHINTYYGYKVSISEGYSYKEFINILEDNGDCLSYWSPDYPDWTNIKNNINEMFGDYI